LTPRIILAAVAAGALLVSAPATMAQAPTEVDVGGGKTVIKLSKKAKNRLKAAGVKLVVSKGAKKAKGGFSVKITGGEMDPISAATADIEHRGTITAKLGRKKAKVSGLTLELGSKDRITATAGSKTITLANLKGGSVARQGFTSTDVKGAKVALTKAGAKALNKGLGVKGVKKGAFGTATVDAKLDQALIDPAAGGTTTLTVDPNTAATFASENISITPIAPATAPTAGTIVFPVIGGLVDVASLSGTGPLTGQIQHSGGILFRDADPPNNELPLTDLFFELDSTPAISVIFGAGRVDAADIDAAGAAKTVSGSSVQWNGSVAKTNAASTAVLNAPAPTGFGMTLQPGTPIGTNATTLTLK
jgi:hypothetical protein